MTVLVDAAAQPNAPVAPADGDLAPPREPPRDSAGVELVAGDHLTTPRALHLHHGIYIGDERVVHHSSVARGDPSSPIKIVSLEEFCNGGVLAVMPRPARGRSREETAARAARSVGKGWRDEIVGNCAQLARWCIEGAEIPPSAPEPDDPVAEVATGPAEAKAATPPTGRLYTALMRAAVWSAGVGADLPVPSYRQTVLVGSLLGSGVALSTIPSPIVIDVAIAASVGAVWNYLIAD